MEVNEGFVERKGRVQEFGSALVKEMAEGWPIHGGVVFAFLDLDGTVLVPEALQLHTEFQDAQSYRSAQLRPLVLLSSKTGFIHAAYNFMNGCMLPALLNFFTLLPLYNLRKGTAYEAVHGNLWLTIQTLNCPIKDSQIPCFEKQTISC